MDDFACICSNSVITCTCLETTKPIPNVKTMCIEITH